MIEIVKVIYIGQSEYEVRLGDLERSPELLIFALRYYLLYHVF